MDNTESLRQKKGKMKKLLTEAIALLCKNSLAFCEELTVEGLIGITVDKEDVLLISMNETLHGNEAACWSDEVQEHMALKSLGYRDSEIDRSLNATDSKCPLSVVTKQDVQGSHIHSTVPQKSAASEETISDVSSLNQPAPRRKQRKPVQIKEEPEELVLDDAEDTDVWETYGKQVNSNSHRPPALNSHVKQEEGASAFAHSNQEFIVMEQDGTLPLTDKKMIPDLLGYRSQSPSASSLACPEKPAHKYSKELGQVVSLKSEGTILSVPSPKNIYNNMKMLGATSLLQQQGTDNQSAFQADTSHFKGKSSYEGLSENEQEEEDAAPGLTMSGEQLYSGGVTQVADLPMDLSLEGANQQQQQAQPAQPQPQQPVRQGHRRRSRFSYSSPGKEIVNAHGAVRCPVCRKWFDSRIKYNRHKRSHRGIFTCKVCGRAYNRKDNMQRHHKLYHSAFLEAQGLGEDEGYTVTHNPQDAEPDDQEDFAASS